MCRRITPQWLACVARDFLDAGWCARDLLQAFDFRPDGTPWEIAYDAADLYRPAGWIAHRLRFWRDDTGAPVLGRRQRQPPAVNRRSIAPEAPPASSAPRVSMPAAVRVALASLATERVAVLRRDRQDRADRRRRRDADYLRTLRPLPG